MMPRCLASTALLATLAAAAFAPRPAAAAVTYYANNLPGFLAALAQASVETFTDTTLNAGLTITGDSVTIDANDNNRMVDTINDGANTSTTFAFATPINGFGGLFDLAGPGGAGTGIRITIDLVMGGLTVLSQAIPNTFNGQFWGFISDVAFDEVRFSEGLQTGSVERYALDNLRYGVTPVPEPATMLLLGAGLLGLAATRRHRVEAPQA